MNRCIIRDKDYTGCCPVVAKALKQGKEILCLCWDLERGDKKVEEYVIDFTCVHSYKYKTKDSMFRNAEPVLKKQYKLKKSWEIIKIAEEGGARLGDNGCWYIDVGRELLNPGLLKSAFGKEICNPEDYPKEWLEEV